MAAEGDDHDDHNDDILHDDSCVYRAVAAGESAEHVRRVIERYAIGYEWRRLEAVNYCGIGGTPLSIAHRRLARGDLVGVLLEAGAETGAVLLGGVDHAMALVIHYDLIDTMRVLLRNGTCNANEKLPHDCGGYLDSGETRDTLYGPPAFCRPVHLAAVPLRWESEDLLHRSSVQPPPRLDALEVLVREFGADVNGRDHNHCTPLHWLAEVAPHLSVGHAERALDALLSLGADLEARESCGSTAIFTAAGVEDANVLKLLLARGASADVFDDHGYSPLMIACSRLGRPHAQEAIQVLLRASSPETRRGVRRGDCSAIDNLLNGSHEPWCQQVIAELLRSGAPVHPNNAARVLPIAARLANQREAELAAVERSVGTTWREHERMVKLAFDFQEVREVDEAVRVREARVRELEAELGGDLGEEQDDDEESGKGEGEEGEEGALGGTLSNDKDGEGDEEAKEENGGGLGDGGGGMEEDLGPRARVGGGGG